MRYLKNQSFAVGLLMASLSLTVASCTKGERNKAGEVGGAGTTTPTPVDPGGTGTATSITIEPIAEPALYTQDTAGASCLSITVKSLSGTAPVADVGIIFSVLSTGTMVDKGTVTPDSGVTGANGEITASYCSGKDEGSITVVAKAGAITVNSSKITITKKPSYEFTYIRSDLDATASKTEGEKVVTLNTLDSGPADCTKIYFKLMKSAAPVKGEIVTFGTQVDFPKGSKLAKKTDAITTALDPITAKKYSVFPATSSGAGEFAVPVCAGVTLGTLIVSGSFTDPEEGRVYTVRSPVIRITAGLTNYTNFSLTFDAGNARNLKAYYNTNSEFDLDVTVQLGARFDGRALNDFPVSFATEVGRYTLADGGIANSETSSAKTTLHALHLVDNYPYPVLNFGQAYPAAQTRCDPLSIATWAAANAKTSVTYKELRQNWRSTAVYAVRGQEYYNDANHNGVYDAGGDGFWDKNQNGIYDAGDVLTLDAGAAGFDPTGEWFIDLPTPFVDVDEDGIFTAAKDLLLGDEYGAPNGKRDADAFIWKYEYFPISMGPSAYGLMMKEIPAGAGYNPTTLTYAANSVTYGVFGKTVITDATQWPTAVTALDRAAGKVSPLVFFAHDLCGSLLAGGTKIDVTYEATHAPAWGERTPLAHIYTQPGDGFLEPTRQLLRSATGGASTEINFNAVDHPANVDSYPIVFESETVPCLNQCTGLTSGPPGVSCDGFSGYIHLTVTEPKLDQHPSATTLTNPISYSAVNACSCIVSGTPGEIIQDKGVCRCANSEAQWNGTICKVN